MQRRNGLDTQLPVVHALGDGEWIPRSDVVVVESLDGGPGVLGVAIPDVAVGSVGSAELYHQSQFVQRSNGGEDRNQLIFEAVSGDAVAVDLRSSLWGSSGPSWRRPSVDPLAVVLGNLVAGPLAEVQESSGDVIGIYRVSQKKCTSSSLYQQATGAFLDSIASHEPGV